MHGCSDGVRSMPRELGRSIGLLWSIQLSLRYHLLRQGTLFARRGGYKLNPLEINGRSLLTWSPINLFLLVYYEISIKDYFNSFAHELLQRKGNVRAAEKLGEGIPYSFNCDITELFEHFLVCFRRSQRWEEGNDCSSDNEWKNSLEIFKAFCGYISEEWE